ncbi:MAG: chitobiase/beta-hexosaminidase C-terminal domain-containing protein [Mogibacterium sp.]|nr:chitobiase/beta-hexosaminidase C-terminal domain-containing protein [Mogibacterium sp.]
MKKALKHLFVLPLLMMMMFASAQTSSFDVYAETIIARIGDPNGPAYSSVNGVNQAIERRSGEINIYMFADWGNEMLIIPSGKHVTLYMQGHVFDRGLSQKSGKGWESDGENIFVKEGASLTIYGGPRDESTTHNNIKVHNSRNEGDRATHEPAGGPIKGGVITGGDSTNGGGAITTKSNVTLTLNQVTIAGCRSEETWSSGGYGGGIWAKGSNVTVRLNDSRITGCHCQNDGGGIYCNKEDNFRVEMTNSSIDHNYARSDGGGINPDGEKFVLKGDGKSEISFNEANDLGGGIYLWNEKAGVSGVKIHDNKASEGGGIYSLEPDSSLTDLEVKDNDRGGIYVKKSGNTISDCTVTGNKSYGVYVSDSVTATTLSGKTVIRDNPSENGRYNLVAEEGVYSHFNIALKRGADIHLRYNILPEDKNNYNACWTITPTNEKVGDYRHFFTSDISNYKITYSYDDRQGKELNFTKDGKYPTWINPSNVKIYTGDPIQHTEQKKVSIGQAGPATVGRVKAGGEVSENGDYSLIRGYLHHEKTDSGTEDTDSVFYYSDGLFFGSPYIYNDHLATASWNLAFAGTYLRVFEAKNDNNNSYYNKHAGGRQFLADIGVPDQNIYVNDSNINQPGTDSIGVIIGSKYLQKYNGNSLEDTDYVLIPIAVRGGGYEAEWASNVKLGPGVERGGEAQGFSEAADQVVEAVDTYIAKYSLEDELSAGKVKFWVSGFSRAGATANITSKRLVEKYASGEDGKKNQVFGYPCEAAKGGTDKAEKLDDKTRYYCIHNLINATDIVPLVGPEEMGFKRYGVDHYVPGSLVNASTADEYKTLVNKNKTTKTAKRAGSAGADINVTTYRDNEILYSKASRYSDYDDESSAYKKYDARRAKMLGHLATIDPTIVFSDYFMPQGIQLSKLAWGGVSTVEGSYEEYFIEDFLSFMQANAVYSRKTWAEDNTAIGGNEYGTIQQAARDSMALLFSMSEASTASAMERAAGIADAVSFVTFSSDISIREIYANVIGEWHTLSDADKLKYINYFWGLVDDSGALDFLPEGEADKLEYNWPTLANLIFTFVDGDWEATPLKWQASTYPSGKKWAYESYRGNGFYMMYAMSLMQHVGSILANHYPEINMAWVRTYDSYYSEADGTIKDEINNEYVVDWIETSEKKNAVPEPGAYVRNDVAAAESGSTQPAASDDKKHEYKELQEGESGKGHAKNRMTGDTRIYLESGNIYDDKDQSLSDLRGEAIYYTLQKTDKDYEKVIGDPDARDELYRGGVDVMHGSDQSGYYKLTAYAMSYGDKSPNAVYYLNVDDGRHNVYIKTNGSEAPRAVSHKEGETVTISAETFTDRYFVNWTVKAKGKGESAAETNVTDKLLGSGDQSKADDASISFTMPAEGADSSDFAWPEDYSLTFTANYREKVTEIIEEIAAPVRGDNLAVSANAAFNKDVSSLSNIPITWTYKNAEGKDVVQAAGTEAYADTVYTAVINIPQDAVSGRIFTTNVSAAVKGSEKTVTVRRNEADGSVSLIVTFDATGKDDPQPEPQPQPQPETITLTVIPHDPNTGDMKSYSIIVEKGRTITLTAPDVTDESFRTWNNKYSDIKVAEADIHKKTISITIPATTQEGVSELKIRADYLPVLNEVTATISAPEAGKALPANKDLKLRISNWFTVDAENLELIWTPQPADGKAEYLTAYTATVRLKPYENGDHKGMIKVTTESGDGSAERYVDPDDIVYADTMTVKFSIDGNKFDATYDKNNRSMSTTFDPVSYTLKKIVQPDSVDISNGASVRGAVPDKVRLILEKGIEIYADVEWGEPIQTSGEGGLDSSSWLIRGQVKLPDGVVNKYGMELTAEATVNVAEAPAVSAPRASVETGTYLANQVVTLSSKTNDAAIWYTTDGSDPKDSSTRKEYKGEEIYVDRNGDQTADNVFTLKTYAVKGGYRDSNEAVYEYRFTNDVPVPAGNVLVYNKSSQIGVDASSFYTLEPESDGVSIDDSGNAVATKPGTYKVRAKLNEEDLNWAIVNEDGSITRTKEDQTIEFTIHAKPVYTISFDLQGGTLEGREGTYTAQYEEDTVIDMPLPVKDGCTFKYWKGSRYNAGDKYKVTEDHTFTAVWEEGSGGHGGDGSGGSGSRGGGAGTGDRNALLEWAALLTASMLGIVMVLNRKRKEREGHK